MLVDNRITSISSQLNFIELLFNLPRLMTMKKEGKSIASYYSGILGQRNYEKVFSPVFSAVLSQNADDFPADMLFNKRPRRKDILKSFTLGRGMQTITDSIAAQPGIKIETNTEVQSVDLNNGLFYLSTGNGQSYSANCLALAAYPAVAENLLRSSFPDLSALLSRIKVESVDTAGVVVSREKVQLKPLAGMVAANDHFYSVVSRDTVRDERYRGFSFHFKQGRLNHDDKLRRISEVLKIDLKHIGHVFSAENRLPCLKSGHAELASDIDKLVSGKKLFLTGNYFSGMAIEDCVSRSLSEFVRLKNML